MWHLNEFSKSAPPQFNTIPGFQKHAQSQQNKARKLYSIVELTLFFWSFRGFVCWNDKKKNRPMPQKTYAWNRTHNKITFKNTRTTNFKNTFAWKLKITHLILRKRFSIFFPCFLVVTQTTTYQQTCKFLEFLLSLTTVERFLPVTTLNSINTSHNE